MNEEEDTPTIDSGPPETLRGHTLEIRVFTTAPVYASDDIRKWAVGGNLTVSLWDKGFGCWSNGQWERLWEIKFLKLPSKSQTETEQVDAFQNLIGILRNAHPGHTFTVVDDEWTAMHPPTK